MREHAQGLKEETHLSIVISGPSSPLRGAVAISAFGLLYLARFERRLGRRRGRAKSGVRKFENGR